MSLSKEDIKAVVAYRKVKSYATLKEAEDMIATEHWNLAVQRMYYACFYMASALLLSGGFKAQTHNGVVGQLGLNYVTKGLLNKDEGRLYSRLLQNRITGDYNDFFDFTSEDVIPLLEPTRQLVAKLESLIVF
ncbi:HEPN domain-containing protein [Phocaeicola sartorii]|uniref:HEPN domain-containing protein n=1 Tax=Phocaeicola sartorii TaxID=671267 RepID=UPI001F582B9D|nr:HEPN domain-containing protein [Phocaeicola sartorii]